MAPAVANAQAVSLENGMDRLGSDYKGFALGQPDPWLCRQACADDRMCKAYTYVRPGVKGPDAMCYLKSSVPPATPNECCASGMKQAPAPGRPAPVIAPVVGRTPTDGSLAAPFGNRLQITPQTTMKQIRALPDDAQVRTANGSVISAKRYKLLADSITSIRKIGATARPDPKLSFSRTQGQAQVQLKPGMNLADIARRPDSDVLQLPDGRKLTVGDLKKISAVRQALGGKSLLAAQPQSQRPSMAGPAIRINSNKDLIKLAYKPDSTVLESSNGKRITLGELRAYNKAREARPGARK